MQGPRSLRRRETEWFGLDRTTFQALAGLAQTNETLFSATLAGARFVKGTTITRMLIDIAIRADNVAQTVQLAWGITTMNADARAAGAFPEADDPSDRAGWMVRGRLITIQASLSDASQWHRKTLDIRSQRILRNEEEELQLILDNQSATDLNFSVYVRVLVKWP